MNHLERTNIARRRRPGRPASRRRLAAAVAAFIWAAGQVATPAMAEAPPVKSPFKPIPAPDQSKAIPLSSVAGAGKEQWEGAGGPGHAVTIVRNVTAPTLTPVLPDPAKASGAAVILAPGGAFMEIMFGNDYDVARRLADKGIAVFVLKYRTRPTSRDPDAFFREFMAFIASGNGQEIKHDVPPEALADGQAALRLVRARATEWKIDPKRVGFVGSSAGGMLALGVGLAEDKAARPDFIAAFSGPLSPMVVPADAPPAYLANALDDPIMVKGKSVALIESWHRSGAPLQAKLYEAGGHGFTDGATPSTALWLDDFVAWMQTRKLIPAH